MKSLLDLLKGGMELAAKNSPTILTAIGVAGTMTTAFLTGRAAIRAQKILEVEEQDHIIDEVPTDLDLKQKAAVTWKVFVPAVVSGTITVTCIVAANRIGAQRAAALGMAYTTAQKLLKNYEEKTVEVVGKKKANDIQNAVIQKQLSEMPKRNREVVVVDGQEHLCFDAWSGRTFRSSHQLIRENILDAGRELLHSGYISLNGVYGWLGLPHIDGGNGVGWNNDQRLDVSFNYQGHNNEPCAAITFVPLPSEKYERFH